MNVWGALQARRVLAALIRSGWTIARQRDSHRVLGRGAKVGLVIGGYLLALVAGWLAGYLYDVRMAAQPYDTSGGMYAAGQAMAVLGSFLLVALVPTVLMLWFLRGNERFWQAVAFASLAFSIVGLIAVLTPLVFPDIYESPVLMFLSLLGLSQLLGMPLWTVAFVMFAFLAPTRPVRRVLIAAIGVEIVIGVCAASHWFVPSSRL